MAKTQPIHLTLCGAFWCLGWISRETEKSKDIAPTSDQPNPRDPPDEKPKMTHVKYFTKTHNWAAKMQ